MRDIEPIEHGGTPGLFVPAPQAQEIADQVRSMQAPARLTVRELVQLQDDEPQRIIGTVNAHIEKLAEVSKALAPTVRLLERLRPMMEAAELLQARMPRQGGIIPAGPPDSRAEAEDRLPHLDAAPVELAADGTARASLNARQIRGLAELLQLIEPGADHAKGLRRLGLAAALRMLDETLESMEDAEDVALMERRLAEPKPAEPWTLDDLLREEGWTREQLLAERQA